MTAPTCVRRFKRAMHRITPRDGKYRRIDTDVDVHRIDGRVRITMRCGKRTETVILSAGEVEEVFRASALLLSDPKGHG